VRSAAALHDLRALDEILHGGEERWAPRRFDRQKVLSGLLRACEKRPVASNQLEKIVDATEEFLWMRRSASALPSEVGELIMQHLKGLTRWRTFRFASVYRDFKM